MRLAALTLLLLTCFGTAFGQQRPPGYPRIVSDGLSLKLTLTHEDSEDYLTVELHNTSNSPIAVPLGEQFWAQGTSFALPYWLTLFAVTRDGLQMKLMPLDGHPGGIGGNLQPFVVTLTPKGSYIMRRPTTGYTLFAPHVSARPVKDVRVYAELRARSRSCSPTFDESCEPDPLLNCWNGVAISNTVDVP